MRVLRGLRSEPISPSRSYPRLAVRRLTRFEEVSTTGERRHYGRAIALQLSPRTLEQTGTLNGKCASILDHVLRDTLRGPSIMERRL